MVVTAFKKSERDPSSFILRLAEMRGETSMTEILFHLQTIIDRPVASVKLCNSLENEVEDTEELLEFKQDK